MEKVPDGKAVGIEDEDKGLEKDVYVSYLRKHHVLQIRHSACSIFHASPRKQKPHSSASNTLASAAYGLGFPE